MKIQAARSILDSDRPRVEQTLGLDSADYSFDLRRYGYDAVLGSLEPATRPRDVARSIDSRSLTVMFGVWNWTTDVDEPTAFVDFRHAR